jgi:hypothetical protein
VTTKTETLPKFEDWTPPWGEDDEKLDVAKVKKLIYNLHDDKRKLGEDKATLQAKVTEVEAERDKHKGELDTIARKDESESDRLKRELKEAQEKAAKPSTDSMEVLRLRVALDKGLTLKQAQRLVGKDESELAADADEYLKDLKPSGKTEDDDDDDGGKPAPRRNPRARSTNRTDPDPAEGGPMTTDQALELIPRP